MIDRAEIQKVADAIAAKYAVEQIILFGSQAYGTPHEDSDVDLLVVMEFEGSSFTKSVELLLAAPRNFSCDLLVMRPSELKRRYVQLNPLVGEAVDRGVILYDRRNTPVGT